MNSLEINSSEVRPNVTFDWANNHLKELVIKDDSPTNPSAWVAEFLMHLLTNEHTHLDYLKLVGKAFTAEENPNLHGIIAEHRHKIDIVVIGEKEEE